MSAWARPGVKCVCVDDRPAVKSGVTTSYLVKGNTYVISSVQSETLRHYRTLQVGTIISVKLSGIDTRTGYNLERFRPLITQSDDIALFAHHLDGVGVDA